MKIAKVGDLIEKACKWEPAQLILPGKPKVEWVNECAETVQ